MKPLIVGVKGNMGQRYAAILKHIGVDFTGIDIGDEIPEQYNGAIICTPTERHIQDIQRFAFDKDGKAIPVLCEKPIGLDLDKVLEFCDWAELEGAKVSMVNQYSYLAGRKKGITYYNYFKHGGDSLAWDCINIVGMANGPVTLSERSPIWTCVINSRELDISDMDYAYRDMVQDWLIGSYKGGDIPYIREAHTKVSAYLEVHSK